MKISKETIDVLQSFSNINNSLIVHAGNRIRTQDSMSKLIAYADIPDSFTDEFAIYDLGEFLGAIALVPDAQLKFDDNTAGNPEAVIKIENDHGTSLNYVGGDSEYIAEAPEKITYPASDSKNVSFDMTQDQLDKVLRACGTLGLERIIVSSKPESTDIVLSASSPDSPSRNTYEIVVGETTLSSEYEFVFKAERFKMVKQDYKVMINPAGISWFQGLNLEYFVALEGTSTFTAA